MADTEDTAQSELVKGVAYEDETHDIWITSTTAVHNKRSLPPAFGKTLPFERKNTTDSKSSIVNAVPCWLCVLVGVVIVVLLILASMAGVLFSSKFQDGLIYSPNNTDFSVPGDVLHESVYIRTKDGVSLNLLLLRYTGSASAGNQSNPNFNSSTSPTILYFYGNSGNMGHRVPHAVLMLVNLKANVVLVDYRGYGKSEGEPSEGGLYLDAEATLDYVMTRPDLDKTKVLLYGRSLGGAVAIRLASANPHRVAAIMVENTFLSIPHMAATLSSLPLHWVPLWFYQNQFLSYRQVALCRMPSLFISGLSDGLIPPAMMKQLYELSPSQSKRLATFPKGTHMTTWQCQGYFPALQQFVRDLLKSHTHEESVQSTANVTII